jgi:sigma-E factor negative regulatory protein RseB
MPAGNGGGVRLAVQIQGLLWALPFALAVGIAQADEGGSDDPFQWLKRMGEAARTLNYQGTFVYRQGSLLDTLRFIHRVDAEGEKERMISLNGVAREVIRDAKEVTCILPDHHSVVVERIGRNGLLPKDFRAAEAGLDAHYRFTLGGEDRVAGRMARGVNIQPKDAYRYGYRLWLDDDTALLLKSEVLGSNGATLEQILYTSIDIGADIPDDLLEPSATGEGYTWHTSGQDGGVSDTGEAVWETPWLPAGFSLRHRDHNPLPNQSARVQHMLFSDGLASFSLYIERLEGDKEPFRGDSRVGAMNAFGTVVDDYQITVVGEVPQDTVERVGRAVRRR